MLECPKQGMTLERIDWQEPVDVEYISYGAE